MFARAKGTAAPAHDAVAPFSLACRLECIQSAEYKECTYRVIYARSAHLASLAIPFATFTRFRFFSANHVSMSAYCSKMCNPVSFRNNAVPTLRYSLDTVDLVLYDVLVYCRIIVSFACTWDRDESTVQQPFLYPRSSQQPFVRLAHLILLSTLSQPGSIVLSKATI